MIAETGSDWQHKFVANGKRLVRQTAVGCVEAAVTKLPLRARTRDQDGALAACSAMDWTVPKLFLKITNITPRQRSEVPSELKSEGQSLIGAMATRAADPSVRSIHRRFDPAF